MRAVRVVTRTFDRKKNKPDINRIYPRVEMCRLLLLLACFLPVITQAAPPNELIKQGEYLVRAAGCVSCHTDHDNKGEFLAGGRVLQTPFGKFYSPNITSSEKHGIGGWSEEDLMAALHEGESPDGDHYYPVFPYTSYTRLKSEDIRAISAYLKTVEGVDRANKEHEIPWYLFRWTLAFWKWLNFEPGEFVQKPDKDEVHNRGAYLVAIGHCTECHTPRDDYGVLDNSRFLAGTKNGPEGETIPNITPHRETGLGKWDADDISYFLETGASPDGDYTGSLMAEVVDDGSRYLTKADRLAIAKYLKALSPVENRELVRKKKKKKKKVVEDEW